MRAILLILCCFACSSSEVQSSASLQPVSMPASQGSVIVEEAPKKTRLDLSGEFQVRFDESAHFRDPIDDVIIIRSDGSLEYRKKIEVIFKNNKESVKEYPGDGKVTTGTASTEELALLKTLLESEAFFSLEDRYRGNMYDVPSYVFRVQTPNQSKIVRINGTTLSKLPGTLLSAIHYTRTLSAKTK